MNNTKFSKGPSDADGMGICTMWGDGEELRVNIDLIAAAPDMYAKLESIAISMECEHGVDTNSIYELLAKARGE